MKFYVKIYIGHIPADGVTRSNKMKMIEFSVKYILVEGRVDIVPKHTERYPLHLKDGLASHVEFST